MNKIYEEIAKLSSKFKTMAYGLTTDKNKILFQKLNKVHLG